MDGGSSLRGQTSSLLGSETGHTIQTARLEDRVRGRLLLIRSRTQDRQHQGRGGPDRLVAVVQEDVELVTDGLSHEAHCPRTGTP